MGPGDYPGEGELRAEAAQTCTSQFEGFAPDAASREGYRMTYLPTPEDEWLAGDRTTRCVAYVGRAVTGSVNDGP
jgi:hypothetical protein